MKKPIKQPRVLKRKRRGKAEMQVLCDAVHDMLADNNPMTVRQVFYQLVSRQVIDKTEAEYNCTKALLKNMRKKELIPYTWIADSTRWMRKPRSYSSLGDMLEQSQQFYRHDLWANQDRYVEIWLEKEALAGVLYFVTEMWDVPLMVTRGYPSITYMHGAADVISNQGKPTYIYYFGDHDPSGKDIRRHVEKEIREFAPSVDLTFESVAVTPEQIKEYELPTRPTKSTDSRAKNFEGQSVEVDAIPIATLKELCSDCIKQNINGEQLTRMRAVEETERQTLEAISEQYHGDHGHPH